jgi:transcriptional regulator with PAS, ATPase and Fis domain
MHIPFRAVSGIAFFASYCIFSKQRFCTANSRNFRFMHNARIIHLPLWIKEGSKEVSFSGKPWEPLQPFLEVVAAMFSVEAVVLDAFGVCVTGTGPYKQGFGIKAPDDTTLAQSLTGRQTMVLNPREDASCLDCSQRDFCRDQANYTAPVEIDGAIVASVQIVAFDEEQRMALIERAEGVFFLITQCIRLLWRTKKLIPVFRDEIAPDEQSLGAIVGNSPPMLYLKEIILKAARANGPVLISGESGTGKELVAAALHNNSQHKNGPFVPVNCGALPEALMKSKIFGYAPGAFSGAQRGGKKKGFGNRRTAGRFFWTK